MALVVNEFSLASWGGMLGRNRVGPSGKLDIAIEINDLGACRQYLNAATAAAVAVPTRMSWFTILAVISNSEDRP